MGSPCPVGIVFASSTPTKRRRLPRWRVYQEGMVSVDEAQVRTHVDEVVRRSVEATLNGLLDAEAD